MRSASVPVACLAWLGAAALAWPQETHAQAFSADYGWMRSSPLKLGLDAPASRALFDLGPVRIGPSLHADARFEGASLSFEAGRHWFGGIGVGRSPQPGLSPAGGGSNVLNIAGGYRWNDGQSLSLQLTGGRGTERLGLSLSYDWPRYFVRLAYDSRLDLVPQDRLRFSAGMRF